MTRRTISILLVFAAILAAVSCRREPLSQDDGMGGIVLRLHSYNALRMETKGVAEDLLDGSRFKNVLVILTDDAGKIVGKTYSDHTAEPKVEDVIEFRALLPGNYHAYAYANIDASQWQDSGALIAGQEKESTTGSSFSSFIDRQLLSLTSAGTDVPVNPSVAMLLTGKLDISVGLSVVSGVLELLRPVVRFKVTVNNNTPFPVTVNSLSFSKFNPDKAYLLSHGSSSGIPAVPDGVTYRKLPAFNPSSPSATVAAESEGTVYTTYLYENAAPDTYKVFTSLTLDRSSELENLLIPGFGVIDYNTLNNMEEDESLDVLVINPRSAVRSGRLYYGIGTANKLAWESCGYANFSDMVARARAIFNEDNNYLYSGFNYSGHQNNRSGYVGWTGNTGETPPTDSGDYYFNYTDARNSYFKTITKYKSGNDYYYKIDGLAECPIQSGDTSIDDVVIEQGTKAGDSSRYPNDINNADLVRFKNTNGDYLKSDNAWDGDASTAMECKLYFNSGGPNHSDYQFVLFGQQKAIGHPLKRILKENNKEVPLTYMARNEEINVIINVFYSNLEGELVFEVDNSHWTDENATTSTHTFN